MNDSQKIIQTASQKLLLYSFGEENYEASEKYLPFFMRIISSRFGNSQWMDENAAKNALNGKLGKLADEGVITKASYYKSQELISRLSKSKAIERKSSIYTLLLKLADFGNSIEFSGNFDSIHNHSNFNVSTFSTKTNANEMELEGIPQISPKPEIDNVKIARIIGNKGNSKISLREIDLVRDVVFCFQGIESISIFYNMNASIFQLRPSTMISEPSRKMVNELCQLGNHYKKIQTFLSFQSFSLVQQSLSYAIKEEINDYLKSLSILENERESLTLRKLYLWMQEPLEGLSWLSIVIDSCIGKEGSLILSIVDSFKHQGSPKIKLLISRLMTYVLQSFLKWLYSWMYLGELNDPDKEFFIGENSSAGNSTFWSDRFFVIFDRIPNFLSEECANKILVAGKSVIFLKKLCGVKDWIPATEVYSTTANSFDYDEIKSLNSWIITVSAEANRKLIYVLETKFQYQVHLQCLKKFLLMGQGDFFHCLIELISPELSKPAFSIGKHNLTSILEIAIRSTNAQFIKPEFINRLQIKLSQPAHGDLGWDTFNLEYLVDQPISTILHKQSMEKYLRIFHFFWKMKRVHFTLSQIWLNDIKEIQYYERISKAKFNFQNFHILRNEMLHLINNLTNYLMLEVVEGNWRKMTNELSKASYLDEVIEIHDRFLNRILESSLLAGSHNSVKAQLLNIFDTISNFKTLNERILNVASQEFKKIVEERQKEEIKRIIDKKSKFQNIFEKKEEIVDLNKLFLIAPETEKHLKGIFREFRESLLIFKKSLDSEEKLKFLSFKIDFNEFYLLQDQDRSLSLDVSKNHLFNDTVATFNFSSKKVFNGKNIEEEKNYTQPTLIPQIFDHENRDGIEEEEFVDEEENSDDDDSY